MNIIKNYSLWYTADVPQHELIGLTSQLGIDNRYSLAEWLLEKTNALKGCNTMVEFYITNNAIKNYRSGTRQPIERIHSAMKDEIQGYYKKPMLTDEQAAEILFDEVLKDELEKIKKSL